MNICLYICIEIISHCCHKRCMNASLSSCIKITKYHRENPTVFCYIPTNASDETDITFNNALSSLIQHIPKHNVLIISGDMNTQIGKDENKKFNTTVWVLTKFIKKKLHRNNKRIWCFEKILEAILTAGE